MVKESNTEIEAESEPEKTEEDSEKNKEASGDTQSQSEEETEEVSEESENKPEEAEESSEKAEETKTKPKKAKKIHKKKKPKPKPKQEEKEESEEKIEEAEEPKPKKAKRKKKKPKPKPKQEEAEEEEKTEETSEETEPQSEEETENKTEEPEEEKTEEAEETPEETETKPKKAKKIHKKKKPKPKTEETEEASEKIPSLEIKTERDIAMDFAEKAYRKFDKLIKSVIFFGSAAKNENVSGSDIDIVIILDDGVVKFDEKMIMWYREELGEVIKANPYKKDLHINTIKLTTWWSDLLRGDQVVLNILRFGEALLDAGGFFNPVKILLQEGRIKSTPESMYTMLNRVPGHILRSKISEMSSIEGCYWAMIESAQALLIIVESLPVNPDEIPEKLEENFVKKGLLKSRYVDNLRNLTALHKKIIHGEVKDIDGRIIDDFQNKSEDFFRVCMKLIDEIVK